MVSAALLENYGVEDHDKEYYETEYTGVGSPHFLGGDHTASFNAFKELLWCDNLTDITERALEACAALEMKERELGKTYMDACCKLLREICFAPKT